MNSTVEPHLDQVALRALGAELITPELVLFPVRHHSPGCAWQLSRLFEQRPPSAVLIEGPRSCTPMIEQLADPQTRAPIAIYTYTVGGPDRAAGYYPFCDHSPELVAIRWAHAHGVPARFIDLDLAEQRLPGDVLAARDGDPVSLLDESRLRLSGTLRLLAARLGCRDDEELWEHLFETTAPFRDPADHVAQVAAYCALARQDSSADERDRDGTTAREAEMVRQIRAALAVRVAGSGPVLVVLGGFHAVAVPGLLREPPQPGIAGPDPASRTRACLVRYAQDRLDRLNGYAAGMTSPGWHQRVWEHQTRRDRAGLPPSGRAREAAALDVLLDVAERLRGRPDGIAVPIPAVRAAYQQALGLARLRGRPGPARGDVRDAVRSCFITGDADLDGHGVLAAADAVLAGTAVGSVPASVGLPPLVTDVLAQGRRLRLRLDDGLPHPVVLDLYRRPDHRSTSRFLHGLEFLGVPFGRRTAGPDYLTGVGAERRRETWEYRWTSATEAELVEASVHGTTLAASVADRFQAVLAARAQAAAPDAAEAARLVVLGCLLGLHDRLADAVPALQAELAGEARFPVAAQALGALSLLGLAREPIEAARLAALPDLVRGCYHRVVFLAGELSRAEPADPLAVVEALRRVQVVLSGLGPGLDPEPFWAAVTRLSTLADRPLLAGAAIGLCHGAGLLAEGVLVDALRGQLDSGLPPAATVGFLRGVITTARELAWQSPEVVGAVDQVLRRWDEATFVSGLPELRLVFASMTPNESHRIAQAVARLHDIDDLALRLQRQVDADQVQRHLASSVTVLELLAADGLDDWVPR